ncbi:MAG: peptidase M23 [Halobacteriovoraceae bacterium]|jgi:murein DD-endopeptidase MepM/ murein hydrolase activator NlpD|nr:peptidase M23 [Halobacteriovoraceae bacterium]
MVLSNMLKLLLSSFVLISFMACETEVSSPQVLLPQIKLTKETFEVKKSEVRRGQGFFQALKNVDIQNQLALDLINSLRDEVEFSKLKVGDVLEATFNQHKELVKFSFSQNPAEKHIVSFDGKTKKWVYSFKEQPTYWYHRILEGELSYGSTLQDDLIAQGLERSVVAEVVNVLLCKVNFRMNARMGDRYKVLLSERRFSGKTIETKVLYTSYQGKKAGFSQAFFYEDSEKGSTYTAHYTEDGQALIRSGLRYPLSRLHVRSGYGYRWHPVTGKRRMHRGVDLRGRIGTPVHAVASGKVIQSTYNKYAGNKVAIKHRDGSVSYYLHLNKRRVNRGDWVRSYQVIGTVGKTGRVTGPHLHFGFRRSNGRWMNPMNKRMIATPKLKGARFVKLQQQIAQTKGLMQDLELSKVSKYLIAEIPNLKTPKSDHFFKFFSEEKALGKPKEAQFLEVVMNTENTPARDLAKI